MMWIKTATRTTMWHVGDPLPPRDGLTMEIYADGHELYFLQRVLEDSEKRSYQIGVLGENVCE